MFEIKKVESIEAPAKSLASKAISCIGTWAFVIWTCVCFGC